MGFDACLVMRAFAGLRYSFNLIEPSFGQSCVCEPVDCQKEKIGCRETSRIHKNGEALPLAPVHVYKKAATAPAKAPAAKRLFLATLETAALPVPLAEAAEPVALEVELDVLPLVVVELVLLLSLPLVLVLLEEELSSDAAPKTPPWTVSGDEVCALAEAALYASRVFSLSLLSNGCQQSRPGLNRCQESTYGGLTTRDMPPSQWPTLEQ